VNSYLVAFLGLEVLALTGYMGWQIVKGRVQLLRQKRELEMRTKLRAARHDGWLEGLSEGKRDQAHDWNTREGRRIYYGFAEDCRNCRTTTACVMPRRREYWNCQKCGHRNPAPLPVEPQKNAVR
jgi:hypothetical protein